MLCAAVCECARVHVCPCASVRVRLYWMCWAPHQYISGHTDFILGDAGGGGGGAGGGTRVHALRVCVCVRAATVQHVSEYKDRN